ncbi:TPA: thioredoxin-disulfide reductase [Candidatus Bathyarchaeota archaeon]|nr:thioredoxin-disulfide reductase [Candidatus Bathyarchaeota archaeon]
MVIYDLIIIGAGPAGLTAGIYGSRSGLETLILEQGMPGGSVAKSPFIENYPGFPEGISGPDLIERMLKQCEKFGAEIKMLEEVIELNLQGKRMIVKTEKNRYSAKAIIIASGSHHRKLNVPGEDRLRGVGVSYCALCDGAFFKDLKVLVVGGGNAAATSALYLSHIASHVTLVHRRDALRAEQILLDEMLKRGVTIFWNTEVKEIAGKEKVRSVVLYNNKTGKMWNEEVDGVFIAVGEVPNSELARNAGVKVDKNGYIIVDSRQRTNVPGVYAAGDVTNYPVKQIGTAVGQGIIAAVEAYGFVKRPYYYEG